MPFAMGLGFSPVAGLAAITSTINLEPEVSPLRLLLYIVAGFLVMGVAALVVTAGRAPASHPLVLFAFVALFVVPPVGAVWMMYVSIRHEKKPFPMVLLALVPFSFLWYYFERVRPGKLTRIRDSA